MAHIPLPPITPRTGLWGLGFRLEMIGWDFGDIASDIRDVWVIGKWLSEPFDLISAGFYYARDKAWQADSELVNAKTWIKGLTDGWVIIDILEILWSQFRHLRTDPVDWVRAKIDQVSGELQYLRNDPYGWMRSRLYAAIPAFYSILDNSAWWIYDKLDERYPDVGAFIRDTWGFIKSRVLGLFGWANKLEYDPSTAIVSWIDWITGWFWGFIRDPRGWVVVWIRTLNYDMNLLFTEPNRWAKEKIAWVLGMTYAEVDNFTVSIIKKIFSAILGNQAGLIDYIRHTVCDLVLRYI